MLVLYEACQVLGEIRLTDLIIEPEQNLMQDLDFFLDGSVSPQPREMISLDVHERSNLTIRFLL